MQGQGVQSGVWHPALALLSAVGLGPLSPPPRGCGDPSASCGPSHISAVVFADKEGSGEEQPQQNPLGL